MRSSPIIMTLSDFSIKNNVFAWMLMFGLIFFGAFALRQMGISEKPDVDFPVVTVRLTYEGAAPEIMEADVVDFVEDAIMSVEGIKSVSSSAKQEEATVTIEFDLDRDIDAALQEVQTKIAQAQRNLPEEMDPPTITKSNPEDQPIMWVALTAQKSPREMMAYARDHVKDRMQTVTGVGEVILSGYVEPNLRLWIHPEKLAQYELTVSDVAQAISREHTEIPAGRIETPEKEINLRSMGEALTPEEFGKIRIDRRGGQPIYTSIFIRDVATVESGLDDIRRISRMKGTPAIGLGIRKQRGSNAVEVADEVKRRIEEIRPTLPEGYAIEINFDTTTFIRETVEEMEFTIILSAILTAIVCFLFLASVGATFNILLSIPTSIVGSFLFLYFFGFTLNTFTLLGLILAIGIVVDDAIMILENITRHQEMGKTPFRAAIDGAREITPAAVATTLAVIAIFIPVIFMEGVIGRYFFQFGITMSVAVGLSLLEAITLTPMRASRLPVAKHGRGKLDKKVTAILDSVMEKYVTYLKACLRHRGKVLIAATVFFGLSMSLYPLLKKEFVPSQDQSSFLLIAKTPLGSSLPATDTKVKELETILASMPSVERYFTAVGGFGGGDVTAANIFVTLKPPKKREPLEKGQGRPSQTDVMAYIGKEAKKIKGLFVIPQDLSTRGFTADRGFPVEFTVRGPDWEKLTGLSDDFAKKMKENPMFKDVDSDYRFGQPEIRILPDREKAAARQVSINEIGQTVNALMGGVQVGKFTEAGHRNDIRLRLAEDARLDAEDIARLSVRNAQGELVPLSAVAEIKEQETLKSITRKDRERAIGISANPAEGVSQQNALLEVEKMAKEVLPEGYRIVLSGSAQTFTESFDSLAVALYLGVIVAYMVLASQYNSFLNPLSVLLALPFSLSGAFIALLLTGYSLNIYSFIGLILLMGIVKKNSILLVDFTNQKRREGMPPVDALLSACPQRLRPILMTTFSTMAAALPPALAFGPGAESRIPMAVVVLGGVFVSTLLTLFVVPCSYSLLTKFEKNTENLS